MSAASVRDAISFMTNAVAVRTQLPKVFVALDHEPPAIQVMTLASAVVLAADALGINPHELIQRVRRMQHDMDTPFAHQWDAMRSYVKEELTQQ